MWSGAALAGAGAIGLLLITLVFIVGVEKGLTGEQRTILVIITALVGLLMGMSLIMQGITLSKKENEATLNEYFSFFYKNKTRALWRDHIAWYIIVKFIENLFFKVSSVAASTWLALYIMIEGNGDWSLLWTTLSSLTLFTGFGLMGMSSAYDWHNTRHMRFIEVMIERLKTKTKTMTPPSVEEQGEKDELSRKEIPITSGTSASEQEEHRTVEEGRVSDVHDAISDRELNVSGTESISGE